MKTLEGLIEVNGGVVDLSKAGAYRLETIEQYITRHNERGGHKSRHPQASPLITHVITLFWLSGESYQCSITADEAARLRDVLPHP